MEKIKWPIIFVTVFILFYQISPFIGVPYPFIAAMFFTAPLLTIWLVFKILRDGEAPDVGGWDESDPSTWYEQH